MSANDYGIKPEWAEAWQSSDSLKNAHLLLSSEKQAIKVCDLALHLLAALMESEFKREHQLSYQGGCLGCLFLNGNELNSRHNHDHDAWLAAARKELEKNG